MAYATRDDVYMTLSAQAFLVQPRPVGAPPSSLALDFNPSTGVIRLPGSGLLATDIVYLITTSGGSLPGGAVALTYYHPLPQAGSDLLQLSATQGGAPLTFSSSGLGWAIVVDAGRRIDWHLDDTAAQIDDCLTAHSTPLLVDPTTGKFPHVVVGMNARMTARAAVTSLQIENAAYKKAVDRLFAQEKSDDAIRADWKAGKPILPTPTDQTPTIADNAMRARGRRPIGWMSRHHGGGSGTPWH